jgi:outer membrane protein OmpA-like peptidoglycan-associated protein
MRRTTWTAGLLAVLAATTLVLPASARAGDVNVNTFRPSMHGGDTLGILTANMPGPWDWGAGAFLTYGHKPLSIEGPAGTRALVENLFVTDLYGYLALWDRLSIGLDVPLALVKGGDTDFVLGDIRLGLKARILGGNGRGWGFAVAQELTFPTSNKDVLAGDELVTGTTTLIGDWSGLGWSAAVNLGFRFKKAVRLGSHETGHQLLLGAGLAAPLICGKLEALGTLEARTSLTKPFDSKYDNGLDLLAGLRGWIGGVGLTLAAGGGALQGYGSPVFRIVAGVEYSPKADAKGCKVPEKPSDRDGDGILDRDDRCPDVPGVPEFQGCPDTDGDGVQDSEDDCPTVPGPKALKGCPDRDGDGIPDKDDDCPDVPGVPEYRGCPPPPKITVTETRIEFEGTVYFDFEQATIKPESFPLLDALAKTMQDHPRIRKVRVDGHTDSVGEDAFNLDLSRRRAAAVVTYMTGKGVAAERLASEGFGETRPIADNATDEGRAKNRRVELTILEMDKAAPAEAPAEKPAEKPAEAPAK